MLGNFLFLFCTSCFAANFVQIKMISQACIIYSNSTTPLVEFEPAIVSITDFDTTFEFINNSPNLCQHISYPSAHGVFVDFSAIPLHLISSVPFFWNVTANSCQNPYFCTLYFGQSKFLKFSSFSSIQSNQVLAQIYQTQQGPYLNFVG